MLKAPIKHDRLITIVGQFPLPTFMTTSTFQKAFKNVPGDVYRSRMKELKSMVPIIAGFMKTVHTQAFELPTGQIELCLRKEKGRLVVEANKPVVLRVVE